jgi:hypothetical protein
MHRRLLGVPEQTELAGFVDHGGIRGDLFLAGARRYAAISVMSSGM